MIWAILALLVACGGAHGDDLFPEHPEQPDPGWCCDGVCGLTAAEADEFTECTCEAPVRRSDGPGKGECLTEPAQ